MKVRVLRSDGHYTTAAVKAKNLRKFYAPTKTVNPKTGRLVKAFMRLPPEVRVARIMQGVPRRLRRITVLVRAKYDKRPGKDSRATKVEVRVVAVLPHGSITDFRDHVAQIVASYASDTEWDVGTEGENDPAEVGALPTVEVVEVYIRDRHNASASATLRDMLLNWFQERDFRAMGEEGVPEQAKRILEAKRDAKGKWRDRKGRFTLSPEWA